MSTEGEASAGPGDPGPPWSYELIRTAVGVYALTLLRARGLGSENVPNGPAVLALGEGCGRMLDVWLAGMFVRRHLEVLVAGEPDLEAALELLAEGRAVAARAVAGDGAAGPEGGGAAETGGPDPDEAPERALGRLALISGAPVVPVDLSGASDLGRFRFPKLVVRYGPPVAFERVPAPSPGQAGAAAAEITRRIAALARD